MLSLNPFKTRLGVRGPFLARVLGISRMLPWETPGAISWVLDPTGRALGRYRGGRREGGGLEIWFISGKGGSHGPGECDAGPLLGYGGPLAVLPGMRLCDTCCTRSARYLLNVQLGQLQRGWSSRAAATT